MTATIYHVASRASVSIATVSRALNAPHRVNSATLERIQRAIDELGFVPKAEATARARRAHQRIGVLAPFFSFYPSFSQRMRGIVPALQHTGFELIVYNADTGARVREYLHSVPVSRRLDGLIIVSLLVDDQSTARLLRHSLPTVLIETTHPDLDSVEIDNRQGGKLAAEYLLAKGHERIGFVGGDRCLDGYALATSELRLAGLRSGLAAGDKAPLLPSIAPGLPTHEEARRQALDLLRRADRPSAIFAANDALALGVLKAARELNLRAPADVAILGFDDADFAEYIGLSTISQSLEESGRLAVELLLSQLAEPARLPRHLQLPLRVVERETT